MFFRLLTIHFCELSFPVVLHQTGSCDLRSLSLFPALEVIQAFLAHLKESPFQLIQPCHQSRCVLIVGILRGVHDAAETGNERLKGTNRVTDSLHRATPAHTWRPELSELKSQSLGCCSQQAKGLQPAQHLLSMATETKPLHAWDVKYLLPDEKQTQNWILAASSQQAWGDHTIQHNYDLFSLLKQLLL